MTNQKPASQPPRYHHGDLRVALIDAAEKLVRDQGAWNFTLREVARTAGVSHNAPYNHFADKQALLATIANRAFAALGASLEHEISKLGDTSLRARIEAAAVAYVGFAVKEPARFRLMFSAELASSNDCELIVASRAAFGALETLISKGVETGELCPDPNQTHALTAWALVHGLSSLILDGRVAPHTDADAVHSLSRLVGRTLIVGLGAPD
jgi:AcrR family transcriptional regulator